MPAGKCTRTVRPACTLEQVLEICAGLIQGLRLPSTEITQEWIGNKASLHEVRDGFLGLGPSRAVSLVRAVQNGSIPDYLFMDPLAPFRSLGIIVIGAPEWNVALPGLFGPSGCSSPPLPDEYSLEIIAKAANWASAEQDTRLILWLALHEIAGMPVNLTTMYGWWGVAHDGFKPGTYHQVHYPNWPIVKKLPWAETRVVDEPAWKVGYLRPPKCLRNHIQTTERMKAKRMGLRVVGAPQQTLMFDLLAIGGEKMAWETTHFHRTLTESGSESVYASFRGYSVKLDECWDPERADPYLGPAVEGVSLSL